MATPLKQPASTTPRQIFTPPTRQGPGKSKKAKAVADAPGTPGQIANLEMIGDKIKVYSLQNLLANKRTFKARPPAMLAEFLPPWFKETVEKPGDKLGGVADLWITNVPRAIVERSRLVNLQRGTLTVHVQSATVRAELDGLLRQGLLQKLQSLSKGTVYRIKTAVDGTGLGAK